MNQFKENKTDNYSWDLIVKPKAGLFMLNIKEVWSYKDLIILFVKRDITALYKQTILGPLWMLIQPVFTTAIYTFTFSISAKLSTDGIPPVLFYLIGQIFWTYFADCLNKTSNTFVTNASVFGKVYFPRLTVPISIILSSIVKLIIQFVLLISVFVFYSLNNNAIIFNWQLCWLLPLVVLMLGIFSLSLGILFSSFTTKYRDFTFLLGFAVQLLMFASCVVFPVAMYSPKIQEILMYNPIVSYMECIKYIFTGKGYFSFFYLTINSIVICALSFIAIIVFNKTEKKFMDTV